MKEDTRMGVQWAYLETLLELYRNLVRAYSKYLLSLDKLAHPNEKKFFKCELSTFYCSVKATFDNWLTIEETKGDIKKYETLTNNDEELKQLFFKINEWAQTKGPFATLVKQNDPYNAFKNG